MGDSNEVRGKASFFKKNDLLYRKFSSPNVERGWHVTLISLV